MRRRRLSFGHNGHEHQHHPAIGGRRSATSCSHVGVQAMTFHSMAVAVKYLRVLITPTGVEQPSASGSTLTNAFADAIARIDRSAVRGRRSGRFQ